MTYLCNKVSPLFCLLFGLLTPLITDLFNHPAGAGVNRSRRKRACRHKVCENTSVQKDQAETSGEDDEENNNGNANQKSPEVTLFLLNKNPWL